MRLGFPTRRFSLVVIQSFNVVVAVVAVVAVVVVFIVVAIIVENKNKNCRW